MKIKFTFLLAVLAILLGNPISCQPNQEMIFLDLSDSSYKSGCLYTAKYTEETYYTEYRKSRLFELIEAELKEELKRITPEELDAYRISEKQFKIPTADTLQQILIKRKGESSILKPYENGFMVCIVDIYPPTKIYSYSELEKLNFEIPYTVLVKPAKLIVSEVSDKPEHLSENQVFLLSGIYSPFVLTNAGEGAHGAFIFYKIKNRLIELGYDLEDDDWMLNKTHAAIKDFCEKNNLPYVIDKRLGVVLGIKM